MDEILQDLRYAARVLRRSPGFALVAVLTLGLGIGVVTTIFSVINALLIRPMPHLETEGLVVVRPYKKDGSESSLSWAQVQALREGVPGFAAVEAYHDDAVVLSPPGGEPERVEAERVTPGLFSTIGARPMLGRLFLPEEGVEGRDRVVILSHVLWTERFAGDRGVLGRTVLVDGAPHTVVGVMPERFGYPDNQPLWIPYAPSPTDQPGMRYLRAVARLRPGTTLAAAEAQTVALSRRLAAADPETNGGRTLRPIDFDVAWSNGFAPILLTMLGAVGFVLLIACANVANLFLARAAGRQREIAVRTALGAGRGRIVRQLLTESAVVALVGGALGIALATLGLRAILASFPFTPPLWMDLGVDRNVLLFTLAVALGTGLLFGLVPALRAARPDLGETLRDGGRGATGGARQGRLRSALVVSELCLATVLLVGAMLMVRSTLRLQGVDPGFASAGALTLRAVAAGERYQDPAARAELFRRAEEAVRAVPGVRAVGAVTHMPLAGTSTTSTYEAEGQPVAAADRPVAQYRGVSEGWFPAMGLAMVRGRAPTAAEVSSGAPVVVVNRTLAERHWPGRDPLGRRIRFGDEWLTVVGVAPDVRMGRLDEPAEPQTYAPYPVRQPGSMTFVVRTAGDPASVAAAARAAVRGLDPQVPVDEVRTLDQVVRASLWQQRLFGGLFVSFAVIALLLAVTGVYGVMSYSVSQRTHEIGVRVALGAKAADVVGMVVGAGARVAVTGVGLGLLAAFALMRLLASQLYGVKATDPLTYATITAVLGGVALLASFLPARRAARVDPMEALRSE